jgi:hypothetical protein
MELHAFIRKAFHTVLNNGVKGFYHDPRTELLDEKCFGSWVDGKWEANKETMKKIFHGDIWGVSHNDLKELTNNFWDILLDNVDDCDLYRMAYNKYSWCMNDIETCVYHKDIAERIIENGFKLAMNGWEIYKLFTYNDYCETDEHLLGRIGLSTKLIAENISTVKGFEGTWNRKSEFEKLSIHQMWHNVVEKKHQTPRPHQECPVKTVVEHFFPSFAPMVEKIEKDVYGIFHHVQHQTNHVKTHNKKEHHRKRELHKGKHEWTGSPAWSFTAF